MMKGRSGEVLWDDTIRHERIEEPAARRVLLAADGVRLPDAADGGGVHEVPWESVATDAGLASSCTKKLRAVRTEFERAPATHCGHAHLRASRITAKTVTPDGPAHTDGAAYIDAERQCLSSLIV
jgi:hypothetical protein